MNLLYTNARIGGFFQSGFGVSFNSSPEDNTLPYPLSLSVCLSFTLLRCATAGRPNDGLTRTRTRREREREGEGGREPRFCICIPDARGARTPPRQEASNV